jgi:ribulose-phosphate 3-epimerase
VTDGSVAHPEIAASILDADLGCLADEIRRAGAAGADRIHLDVMDAHFVPNLTFGPRTIAALRGVTRLPFDAHLMTSEPGRFLDEYLDAGCDSVTLHVEIEEEIAPTLARIRSAGRLAGLALKPATPLSDLEPYRGALDIVMVMTVEPGFGGQAFMPEPARKISSASRYLAPNGRVHVDGGVNADTVRIAAGLGADVLVVGSALWRATDTAEAVRAIRATAAAARLAPASGSPGATEAGSPGATGVRSPGATYSAVHPRQPS